MSRRAALSLLLVGCLLALTGCSGAGSNAAKGTPTPQVSTSTPPATSPASGTDPALGAWAQPVGGHSRDDQMAAVTNLEKALGHKLAIDHFYVSNFDPVETWSWRLQWDVAQGRVPMITMGFGADTLRVSAGDDDARLRSYAEAIRASGAQTVLIRYAQEMDGALNQGWVHSGPAFVAAWRHVHSLFTGLNVQWVWSPNAPAFAGKNGGVDAYWPGPSQVDWVAADGYNFYTCMNHKEWRTFTEIFSAFLTWGTARGKPMMLAEFGSLQDPSQSDRQAQWLSDAILQAKKYPLLKAMVYYNSDGHGCDWRLDSSPQTAKILPKLALSPSLAAAQGQ